MIFMPGRGERKRWIASENFYNKKGLRYPKNGLLFPILNNVPGN